MPSETRSDPMIAPEAPSTEKVEDYDLLHLVTYLRLLDAAAENADWQDVARIVLNADVENDPGSAWRTYETHLRRARWMAEQGPSGLLETAKRH